MEKSTLLPIISKVRKLNQRSKLFIEFHKTHEVIGHADTSPTCRAAHFYPHLQSVGGEHSRRSSVTWWKRWHSCEQLSVSSMKPTELMPYPKWCFFDDCVWNNYSIHIDLALFFVHVNHQQSFGSGECGGGKLPLDPVSSSFL